MAMGPVAALAPGLQLAVAGARLRQQVAQGVFQYALGADPVIVCLGALVVRNVGQRLHAGRAAVQRHVPEGAAQVQRVGVTARHLVGQPGAVCVL